jgi:probable HAF family extracellular repeat protein
MWRIGLVIALLSLMHLATPEATTLAAPIAQPSPPSRYIYTNLGTLGSQGGSSAFGINNGGQVVGASGTNVFGASHAFLWQNGVLSDLGTLSSGTFAASAAYGINDDGVIVGQTNVNPSNEPPHAFRYSNGVMIDLGTGFGAGSFSRAWDINNHNHIVGERSLQQSSPKRAFLLRNGQFLDLGTLGGSSQLPFSTDSAAYAINDLGQIVGIALPPQPPHHAFLWENGVMRDLGTLGGNNEATIAYAINNVSQVVGRSPTTGGTMIHAFLWQNNAMQDLGTLGGAFSEAFGINKSGQVVGQSTTPNGALHAFIWQNGQMVDLNTRVANLPAGVFLQTARAISDDGHIVGTACLGSCDGGGSRAFLLTPVSFSPAPP